MSEHILFDVDTRPPNAIRVLSTFQRRPAWSEPRSHASTSRSSVLCRTHVGKLEEVQETRQAIACTFDGMEMKHEKKAQCRVTCCCSLCDHLL
eukprot:908398-Pelagomonas_calceolata.AAC.6